MNKRFLMACRCQKVDCIPVWFMRQAGRYLPEYQELRKKYSLMEICQTPLLCVQMTLLPVEKLKVDAAILFSDILLPLKFMGVDFDIEENTGPVIYSQELHLLKDLHPERDLDFVLESINILKQKLDVPLIGFAGAPFTLASYLIEKKTSRDFVKTKHFMYAQTKLWHNLMQLLTNSMIEYLKAQIEAGVDAVQIFDSWVGCLCPEDYKEFVLPYNQQIFENVKKMDVPAIHFATDAGALLELMKEAGGDVIGIDWRVPIPEAIKRLGNTVAIQGNLDPALMLAPWEIIQQRTIQLLQYVKNRQGYIFNLGHGVLPETPVENLCRLVEFVHEYTRNR